MFLPRRIKHCRVCGTEVEYRVPADDNRERAVCPACGEIHYENPINVVGTVPVWDDQVLLCRRNIEPRYGLWTLPAGFLELAESTAEGAIRETVDRSRVELVELDLHINDPAFADAMADRLLAMLAERTGAEPALAAH